MDVLFRACIVCVALAAFPLYGLAQSAKARVEQELKRPSADQTRAAEFDSALKKAVESAAKSPPREPKFDAPAGECAFLTKPHVRSDGGGLNRHGAGSIVCHEGRALRCDAANWIDRGACSIYPGILSAAEVEGSSISTQILLPPDEQTAGQATPTAPSQPSGEGQQLLGESAHKRQLEEQESKARLLEEEANRARRDAAAGAGYRPVPSGGTSTYRQVPDDSDSQRRPAIPAITGGRTAQPSVNNAAICAEGRRTLAEADQVISQIQQAGRSTSTTGGMNPRYQQMYQQAQQQRQGILSTMRSYGCL